MAEERILSVVDRPRVSWLSSALYESIEFLEKVPRSIIWTPYSYVVVAANTLWAIPFLDTHFTFGLDLNGYFWWSIVWIPLLATGIAIALGIVWFFVILVANKLKNVGFAAITGLRFCILLWGLPGAIWALLWSTLIRFWISKFLLAVAIANALTAVTLIVVAMTTGQGSNLMLIIPAVVLAISSLTGGYAWANQYGSGFIGNSGILVGIMLFLWGLWVWLFALAAGFVAVAAPLAIPWLLGYLLSPVSEMPMFEPWWINLIAIAALTGIFAVAPWVATLKNGGVTEMISNDYYGQ